jgi:hypothetical protein
MTEFSPFLAPFSWGNRSSARENEWQKKVGLLNWEDRCGIGRDM